MAKNLIVAIIDDDDSIRAATSRLVRSLGWQAQTFTRAQDFLDANEATPVTCIISDIQMPVMSGLEMLRILNTRGSDVPVIFITAFCTDAIRREALRAGAVAFLCKPVVGAEIQGCLEGVLAGSLSRRP
ncbi:response regulator transcription factor [Cupriavidus pauculus]|uniref:response regulator transcription factor n=1 Tax=Cupriavidus pauculus TaxID=82633 RepID=UPI003857A018